MRSLRFVSSNPHKIDEAKGILASVGVDVIPLSIKIDEIQSEDVNKLVKDKLIKAFNAIGRPLFVEHTGLYVEGLNGLPAGLTQIFWDRLQADNFASLVNSLPKSSVIAKTMVGYCDGRKLHFFEGSINGTVPPTPIGDRQFQWDCVFIPDGETKSFAELGSRKNEISMRRVALDKLAEFLKVVAI